MATTVTSQTGTLNLKDFGKGLLMAVLTPVLAIIIQSLNNGTLTFDWKVIGIAAASGGLAYIIKNFLTPSQVVIQNPTKAQVEAVKNGNAVAQIVSK